MTHEEVFALVPGREMDALVHLVVTSAGPAGGTGEAPAYSTDDLEALRAARLLGLVCFQTLEPDESEAWGARPKDGGRAVVATGPTRALAICRAALLGPNAC